MASSLLEGTRPGSSPSASRGDACCDGVCGRKRDEEEVARPARGDPRDSSASRPSLAREMAGLKPGLLQGGAGGSRRHRHDSELLLGAGLGGARGLAEGLPLLAWPSAPAAGWSGCCGVVAELLGGVCVAASDVQSCSVILAACLAPPRGLRGGGPVSAGFRPARAATRHCFSSSAAARRPEPGGENGLLEQAGHLLAGDAVESLPLALRPAAGWCAALSVLVLCLLGMAGVSDGFGGLGLWCCWEALACKGVAERALAGPSGGWVSGVAGPAAAAASCAARLRLTPCLRGPAPAITTCRVIMLSPSTDHCNISPLALVPRLGNHLKWSSTTCTD